MHVNNLLVIAFMPHGHTNVEKFDNKLYSVIPQLFDW
jgi:hypothetical protein